MSNRYWTILPAVLLSALLAACNGGDGGRTPVAAGGMAPDGGATMPMPDDGGTAMPDDGGTAMPDDGGTRPVDRAPPPVDRGPPPDDGVSYGSYGVWNQAIANALPDLYVCEPPCAVLAKPDNFVSPFGAAEAFDPANDSWAATWRGGIEGYRNTDPDRDGPMHRRWRGEAVLKIDSSNPTQVKFWTEDPRYYTDNGFSGVGADNIPDTESRAWTATLSTAAGEKGYFSRDGIHGQFARPGTGETVPPSAIGHIQRSGHLAVFDVSREP